MQALRHWSCVINHGHSIFDATSNQDGTMVELHLFVGMGLPDGIAYLTEEQVINLTIFLNSLVQTGKSLPPQEGVNNASI